MPQQPSGWAPVTAADVQGWTPVEETPQQDPWERAKRAAGNAVLGALGFGPNDKVADTIGDTAIGAVKGAGHTVTSLGKLVNKVPGFQEGVNMLYGTPNLSQNAFQQADQATTPTNTAQKVGYGAEQTGEFFLPAGATENTARGLAKVVPQFTNAPRLVKAGLSAIPRAAAEGATAATVTAAQGGDPTTAGLTAAAFPLAGKIATSGLPASDALREAAEKQVNQFLGPTKERYKAMAQRLVPSMLSRGLTGSREALAERAAGEAEQAGDAIDTAIQQYGTRQTGVQPVIDALEQAKEPFRRTVPTQVTTPAQTVATGLVDASGKPLTRTIPASTQTVNKVVELDSRPIEQLGKLQDILRDLGPNATAEQLIATRRAWDSVVADAGGFAHRAPGGIGLPLQDKSEAWAKFQGTKAIRQVLDQQVPELSALNKEYSFWQGLDDVLNQTLQRKAPQGPGLTQQVANLGGTVAGVATGNVKSALAIGQVAKLYNQVTNSPRWLLASAQAKDALAKAIMTNRPEEIMAALGRIMAAQASQGTQQQ